jgi:hypothetical protein
MQEQGVVPPKEDPVRNLVIATWLVGAGLAACAESDNTTEPNPITSRDLIAQNPTFAIDAAGVRATMEVTWSLPFRAQTKTVALVAQRGAVPISIDANNNLVVRDFRISLAPVSLADWGQDTLVDVQLGLRGPVTCETTSWSDDLQFASCDHLLATLVIDGRLLKNKVASPVVVGLATDVDLSLFVAPYDDTARWLWINGSGGTNFRWGNLSVMTNLETHLDAYNGLVE